mmetsp:Transcript_14796/g.28644  ORF Transcript_14796/g.28644 Transcript_14796/m.28644 type:complete len:973 (-) Transcript_14796:180-3098(-)
MAYKEVVEVEESEDEASAANEALSNAQIDLHNEGQREVQVIHEATTLSPRSVVLRWSRLVLGAKAALAPPWNCGICTFENQGASVECEMCSASKDEALPLKKRNSQGDDDNEEEEEEEDPQSKTRTIVEYQVKFHREKRTFTSWRHSELTSEHEIIIDGLEPNTLYKGILKYRTQEVTAEGNPGEKKSKPSSWVDVDEPIYFKTFSTDEALRLENLERVEQFLLGNLQPYPEDEARPDGVADKVSRAGSTLLQASGVVGFGGIYAKLARSAMALHRSGLAGIIFREDIQQMVVMLASNVGRVAKEFDLSRMEITAGCYYMLWEHKRERLLRPDMEKHEHAMEQLGVLQDEADLSLLDEVAYYYGFSQLSYRDTPSQVQWVLRNYPHRDGSFQLVACRSTSEKFRPAFALMASAQDKEAVLSVRGTHGPDDVLTDMHFDYEEAKFRFHADQAYRVHAGMLRAARWMLKGDSKGYMREHKMSEHHDTDLAEDAGGGLGLALAQLHQQGYKISFTGHSLGAGVATLLALLVADDIPDIRINVYGFGSPACVDEPLAEACKGRFQEPYGTIEAEPIPRLGSRVTVHNFVFRDDVVSRLSLFNARKFVAEIKNRKAHWAPLLQEDKGAITSRAFSLWAPQQRGHYAGAEARAAAKAIQAEAEANNQADSNISSEDAEEEEVQIVEDTKKDDSTSSSSASKAKSAASSMLGLASKVVSRISQGRKAPQTAAEHIQATADVVGQVEQEKERQQSLERAPSSQTVYDDGSTSEKLEVSHQTDMHDAKVAENTRLGEAMDVDSDHVDSATETTEEKERKEPTFDHADRMVIPGVILHAYTWRGAELLSLVDYRFEGLRRLGASQSLISDHRNARLPEAFRNVRAARKLGKDFAPPMWQSIEDHLAHGLYVKCSVCHYFVGWHHTGDSQAVEVRAAKHCRACGLLVCGRCSKHKAPLPQHGMLYPVRICDICYTTQQLGDSI